MANRGTRPTDPILKLLRDAKRRANRKGLPFSLTAGDIHIPQRCPALGIVLRKNRGRSGDDSPTLDRLIPDRGYVAGNVAVISGLANQIKSSATYEQIERVAVWLKGVTSEL